MALNEIRLCIVGDMYSGKSNLVVRFVEDIFVGTDYDPFREDTFRKQVSLDDFRGIVDICDPGYVEDAPMLWSSLLRQSGGILMTYSISSRQTFHGLRNHLELVKSAKESDFFPMVLVGTKCDLEAEREVMFQEGEALAKHWSCPFFETSALNRINVDECFQKLIEEVVLATTPAIVTVENRVFGIPFGRSYYIPRPTRPTKKLIQTILVPSRYPLLRSIERNLLYESVVFDCIVECNDDAISVHKSIFRISSPIFAKLVEDNEKNPLTDGMMKIKIEEKSSEGVRKMIEFIYLNRNCRFTYRNCIDWNLLELAEKYEIEEFAEMCNRLMDRAFIMKEREREEKLSKLRSNHGSNRKKETKFRDRQSRLFKNGSSSDEEEIVQVENEMDSMQEPDIIRQTEIDNMMPSLHLGSPNSIIIKLWANKKDCDMSLAVGEAEQQVHKAILIERCSYFKGLFEFNETTKKIFIENVSPESLAAFCKYIYTCDEMLVTAENVFDLLYLSDYYGCDSRLKLSCQKFLSSAIRSDTIGYFDTFKWALLTDCEILLKHISYWVVFGHFDEIERRSREGIRRWINNKTGADTSDEFLNTMQDTMKEYQNLCKHLEEKARTWELGSGRGGSSWFGRSNFRPLPRQLPFYQTVVEDSTELFADSFEELVIE